MISVLSTTHEFIFCIIHINDLYIFLLLFEDVLVLMNYPIKIEY